MFLPGILKPNVQSIAQGLSLAIPFQNGGMPWVLRGSVPGVFQGSSYRGVGAAGIGMKGANGCWDAISGVTYDFPTTQGTLLAYSTDDFGSADPIACYLTSNNNSYPLGPSVEFLKYNDGNMYVGWIAGGDKRIIFSNVGLWSAGETFTKGLTWNSAGQVAYIKGTARASNASTGFSSTAGSPFSIGKLTGGLGYWNTTDSGTIYYVLVFDRAFSPSEMAYAEANPWWWAESPLSRVGVSNLTTSFAANTVWVM